jgi:hypothetical protein
MAGSLKPGFRWPILGADRGLACDPCVIRFGIKEGVGNERASSTACHKQGEDREECKEAETRTITPAFFHRALLPFGRDPCAVLPARIDGEGMLLRGAGQAVIEHRDGYTRAYLERHEAHVAQRLVQSAAGQARSEIRSLLSRHHLRRSSMASGLILSPACSVKYRPAYSTAVRLWSCSMTSAKNCSLSLRGMS